jgi:hypothetical protein
MVGDGTPRDTTADNDDLGLGWKRIGQVTVSG